MCYWYTYIHKWISELYWKLMKNWWIIFIVGPASAWDYGSGDQATTSEDLYYASHDTSGYFFRGLILRLTWHFIEDLYYASHDTSGYNHHHKYDIILASISFSHSSVSWVIYYISSSGNVHSVFIAIQYPWLAVYGDPQEYNIRSIISGVPLLRGFWNTGVREYQLSGSSRIIMSISRKGEIMNQVIESGVTISGQEYQYQMIACQVSGVRNQVSGN